MPNAMKKGWDNRHFGRLFYEQIGPERWVLTQPFTYTGSNGFHVEVPVGFETDLASVPRIAWTLYSKTGDLARPSIPHDWLYVNAQVRDEATRRSIDDIFMVAMNDAGIAKLGRNIVYRAVRDFGATVFYRKRQ